MKFTIGFPKDKLKPFVMIRSELIAAGYNAELGLNAFPCTEQFQSEVFKIKYPSPVGVLIFVVEGDAK